jgi:bacteriorhodopsin
MNDKMVEYTFYFTYAFLVTTGTITFIEALRTKVDSMRHILNLETCISIIAAFFYGKFVQEFKSESMAIDYGSINLNRYVDWAITTPIMLLVLILAFRFNSTQKASVKFSDFVLILLLNYAMLGSGYLGEIGTWSRNMANFIGFVFFAGLYGFIYNTYLKASKNMTNLYLFSIFVVLWAFYGVFYQMEEQSRNVGYNILDLFSKCFVGIYFWAYFTKIFQ